MFGAVLHKYCGVFFFEGGGGTFLLQRTQSENHLRVALELMCTSSRPPVCPAISM